MLALQSLHGATLHIREPFASTKRAISVGERVGNRGQTAEVFRAVGSEFRSIVLKIYHSPPAPDLEEFVFKARQERLDQIPILSEGDPGITHHPAVAAPLYLVVDEFDSIVGVAVLAVDTREFRDLHAFFASPFVRNLPTSLAAGARLAHTVQQLHDKGFIVGDLSPSNVLVSRQGYVSLIDADSYGFCDQVGARRPPTHVTLGARAPESIGEALNASADRFLVGVHLLTMLMGGRHPFGGVDPLDDVGSTQSNIDRGLSWLFSEQIVLPPEVRSSAGLNDLPLSLARELAALISHDPALRTPSLEPLLLELRRSEYLLVPRSCGHVAFTALPCPQCKRPDVAPSDRIWNGGSSMSAQSANGTVEAPSGAEQQKEVLHVMESKADPGARSKVFAIMCIGIPAIIVFILLVVVVHAIWP